MTSTHALMGPRRAAPGTSEDTRATRGGGEARPGPAAPTVLPRACGARARCVTPNDRHLARLMDWDKPVPTTLICSRHEGHDGDHADLRECISWPRED